MMGSYTGFYRVVFPIGGLETFEVPALIINPQLGVDTIHYRDHFPISVKRAKALAKREIRKARAREAAFAKYLESMGWS